MTDGIQSKQQHSALGAWLVTLQFGLLFFLTLQATPRMVQGDLPWISMALFALSALCGLWTLAHNRLGNFNIRPTPKAGGVLVTSGPYAWMRHPMYSAVLLVAAALAWLCPLWTGLTSWFALVAVLWVKSGVEERALCLLYPDYSSYAQGVKRFIPWVV